jgi:uncharacterized protein (TIRG00374 family)
LKNVDFQELRANYRQAKTPYIVGAIIFFFAGYACRIERWRLMLMQENPGLRYGHCAGPLMASVAANNVLLFRAGDILRAFAFNGRLGISASTSLTSLFVERLLDLLMVVSFLGVALAYFGMDSSALVGVGGGTLIFAAVVILFLLFFPTTFKRPAFFISGYIFNINTRVGDRLNVAFLKIFTALDHTSRRGTISKLVFWSFIAWIAEGFVFWFIALSIPSITNDLAAWIALPVGTLATIIPGTPGYIGTFDYSTAESMIAMGNSSTGSAAFAFMVHLVLWLPPTLVGGIYLIANPIKKIKEQGKNHDWP